MISKAHSPASDSTSAQFGLDRWRAILFPLAVLGLGWMIYRNREALASLKVTDPSFLVLALVANLGVVSINPLLFQLMLKSQGISARGRLVFKTIILSTALNSVLPHGGNLAGALLLKQEAQLKIIQFIACVVGTTLLGIAVYSWSGFGAAAMAAVIHRDSASTTLIWVGAAVSGLSLLPWVVPTERLPFAFLRKIAEGVRALRASKMLGRAASLSFVQLVLQAVALWAGYRAFGIALDGVSVSIAASFGLLTSLVSLVPGSLGIWEATTAAVAYQIGVPVATTLAAVLACRVVFWVATGMLSGISLLIKESAV